MGKAVKSVTKAATKAVKSVAKATTNSVKNVVVSTGKGLESSVSSVKHLAQGDVKGAVRKLTDVAANAGNVASYGAVDLTGRKDGIINIDKNKYVDSVIGVNKEKKEQTPTNTANADIDGLLQYVSDLRSRKARRSRASTNNTGGGSSSDTNKLSGITALGV